MNENTGKIYDADQVAARIARKPETASQYREIPPEYDEMVRGLTRAQRRRLCKERGWPMWGKSGDRIDGGKIIAFGGGPSYGKTKMSMAALAASLTAGLAQSSYGAPFIEMLTKDGSKKLPFTEAEINEVAKAPDPAQAMKDLIALKDPRP